jgi:MFS family permease
MEKGCEKDLTNFLCMEPAPANSPWYRGLTRAQWLVLAVAFLGWVFDIFDVAIFNLAKGSMLSELVGPERMKQEGAYIDGFLLTILLIGWSAGGLIFGILADRWGRTRTMIATILIYAVFTGLHALCQTWEQIAFVRFVTALGIGGEWAAGAALLAEAFPDKARAPAAGLLQSAAAVGPVLAALANLAVPAEHWRWLFLIGILPAIVTIVIRLGVEESDKWKHAREKQGRTSLFEPIRGLFAIPKWRRHAVVALILGAVLVAGSNNVSYWLPNLVESVSTGLDAQVVKDRKSEATMILHIGTILGVLFVPWLCERIGRKLTIGIFFLMSPAAVVLATYGGGSYERLLFLAPLMSFFAIGVSAAFVLYLPELFPTRLRATGAGLAYNVGRILASGVPLLTAALMWRSQNPIADGVARTALVLAVGILALPFAPETRGKPLPEDEDAAEAGPAG